MTRMAVQYGRLLKQTFIYSPTRINTEQNLGLLDKREAAFVIRGLCNNTRGCGYYKIRKGDRRLCLSTFNSDIFVGQKQL